MAPTRVEEPDGLVDPGPVSKTSPRTTTRSTPSAVEQAQGPFEQLDRLMDVRDDSQLHEIRLRAIVKGLGAAGGTWTFEAR